MGRVTIGPAPLDRTTLDVEIARLRDLDIGALRARWHTVFRRKAPAPLSRHLLFRTLAYRLQAECLGDLGPDIRRLLTNATPDVDRGQLAATLSALQSEPSLKPGTVLTREWNGHSHHVMVVVGGFSWEGQTYPSLSKVASAITGTRWNGPRFFGLRDRVPGRTST